MKPFNLRHANEISISWKLTKKGGCSKAKRMCCYCRDTTSSMFHVPNEICCASYDHVLPLLPEYRENCRCFCKMMTSKDCHNVVLNKCNSFLGQVNNDVKNMSSKNKSQLTTEDATEVIVSHFSIDHIPSAEKEQSEFVHLLFEEYFLHKLNAVVK